MNLLWVVQIQGYGYSVLFENDECIVSQSKLKDVAVHLARTGTGYRVNGNVTNNEGVFFSNTLEKNNSDAKLWHERFGHSSPVMMNEARKPSRLIGGPRPSMNFNSVLQCHGCDIGKMKNRSYWSSRVTKSEILQLIHTDVCGPMKVEFVGHAQYFLIFVDDLSRKTFIYFMRKKSEVEQAIKNFINHVERECGKKVKVIKSDNGGEYISASLSNYFEQNGIEHQYSAPYTPQQNDVAERTNRILLEKGRCMMLDSGLPISFWAEAISTAAYIPNVTSTGVLSWKTPNER